MSQDIATPPEFPPTAPRPSEGFAIAILIVTFALATLSWLMVAAAPDAVGLFVWAAVIITAALAYFDAQRLKIWSDAQPDTQLAGEKRTPLVPFLVTLTFLLLWVVALPVHFWRRRKFGAKNYFWPALAGALALTGAALVPLFLSPTLPAANSREVVLLVQKVMTDSLSKSPDAARFGTPTITNVVEQSFDKERQVREVKCTLTTKLGPEDLFFTVDWLDREKNLFQVKIKPAVHTLPAADAAEVVHLVVKIVTDSLSQQPDAARYGTPKISNVAERSFDEERQVRDVRCTLTTNLGPEDFYYTVEWQDRTKNLFQVKTRAKP
jgi:hypothetical protein